MWWSRRILDRKLKRTTRGCCNLTKFRGESDDAERDLHFAVLPARGSCIERGGPLVYRYIDSNTLEMRVVIAEGSFAFLHIARAHVYISFSFFSRYILGVNWLFNCIFCHSIFRFIILIIYLFFHNCTNK